MSFRYYDAGPAPKPGQQKVLLATTAYDNPDASNSYSMAQSREALHKAGILTAHTILSGYCHVDDARNIVVRLFLSSDATDLVFLDADVSWEPESLVKLCQFDCDLVGGVYPYRRDTGREGLPMRSLPGHLEAKDGLVEVEGLPTGFMRMRRGMLEKMAAASESFIHSDGQKVPLLFYRDLLDGGRRGGDIGFCMRWREMGGQVFAAADLRLGHMGKVIVKDSYSAMLRRMSGDSLKYVCDHIRAGTETADIYEEAIRFADNPWGARRDVLSLCVEAARKAGGPIIETGSGLSTVLMAAATKEKVWCIEHSEYFANELRRLAALAGVGNIALVTAELKDGWYDLMEDAAAFPHRFAVGLVDGPPRIHGDRLKFFDIFGDRTSLIICDDSDDADYVEKIAKWAKDRNRKFTRGDDRGSMVWPVERMQEAA